MAANLNACLAVAGKDQRVRRSQPRWLQESENCFVTPTWRSMKLRLYLESTRDVYQK